MNPDPALAQLQQEVATLRQQLNELRQFLKIQHEDTPERKAVALRITCTTLELCHPTAPDDVQGTLCATGKGPFLNLWSRDSDASLLVTAQDTPVIQLFSKDGEEAIQLAVDNETGRGQIAIFDQGKPRAVMKSTEKGGVLSVVHDDGKTRACIISEADGGEAHVIGAQGHSAVKLAGNPELGGYLTVNNLAGRPRAAISAIENGAALHILKEEGQIGVGLIAKSDSAALFVQTGDEHQNRVCLFSHDAGSYVRIYDAQGTVSAELTDESAGGGLRLCDHNGKDRHTLRQTEQGPILCLRSAKGENLATLSALNDDGMADLCSGTGHKATLVSAKAGPALFLSDPQGAPQVVLAGGGGTPGLLLQPQAGQWPVAGFYIGEHGGVCLLSDREGIRRAGLAANLTGGQVSIFNDLGIIRAELACADDGGLLKLNWGGNIGVSAIATHQGGGVLVNDGNGELQASLPASDDEED